MADIFDEIEEDLRRDRMKLLWQRYGNYIIGLAVLIIIVVAGNQGYDYWKNSESQSAGDAFFEAVGADESLDALTTLVPNLPVGYEMLARFRIAALHAEDGDNFAAEQSFLALSEDNSIDIFYREVALLLSVMNAPSSVDKNILIGRLSSLSAFPGSLQGLALETSAGLYLELNERDKAISTLTEASKLPDISSSLKQRISQSLSIISEKYTDNRSVISE